MIDATSTETPGAVSGGVRMMLRLEGLALFAGMTLLYGVAVGTWWVYALLFFTPDLSFLAYLAGPKTGAFVYNAMHTYLTPLILTVIGYAIASPPMIAMATIWLAHIGFDRALGYGLK